MFILRRITSESIEINTCLGKDYVLVLRERNEQEFNRTAEVAEWKDAKIIDEIYGFITFNDGADVVPLYLKSKYFVMASDGQTFSNISFK